MAEQHIYSLQQLLDHLGLSYDEDRGKMDCFSCGKKKKVNLDFDSNRYRCPACGESGGVLHLFAKMQMGIPRDAFPAKHDREQINQIRSALCEFMEGYEAVRPSYPTKAKKEERPKIPVAPDDKLDAVYRAMQKIPALQLTEKHRKELLRRGLTDEVIVRNGYLSIPSDLPCSQRYADIYALEGGEHRREKMNWISANQIAFGLQIADSVIAQGYDPTGIPGFFKFGVHWCFWSVPGILIPTRNMNGQIVIWQVRRDILLHKDDAKYITVASRKLPGHVTGSVSRCHFPLGNAPLSDAVPLLVTEGPLKADIACFLYGGPVLFAAIPGIQTTKDLLSYSRRFRRKNIRTVYNALDMDRFTNPNVRKGSKKLELQLSQKGLSFRNMCWGESFAVSRLMFCSMIARKRKVAVPMHFASDVQPSVFDRLNAVSEALDNVGINPFQYKNKNGDIQTMYWDPDTKGIDDYLFNR